MNNMESEDNPHTPAARRSDQTAPEGVRSVPQGAPRSVTAELIERTIRGWQPYYAKRLANKPDVGAAHPGIECGSAWTPAFSGASLTFDDLPLSALCQHFPSSNLLDLTLIAASLRTVIDNWPMLSADVRQKVEAMCLQPVTLDDQSRENS